MSDNPTVKEVLEIIWQTPHHYTHFASVWAKSRLQRWIRNNACFQYIYLIEADAVEAGQISFQQLMDFAQLILLSKGAYYE